MLNSSPSRRHYLSSWFFSLTLIACFAVVERAQSAVDGFDPNANGTINVIVVQPDGKILIAGSFTALAPNGGATVTRNRIARLNLDGTLDTAFNPNASAFVGAVAVLADGKILVGGSFTTVGGQARNRIARLDAVTGLADSWDPNIAGPTSPQINSLVVQPDGKVLASGLFASVGVQTRNNIARLDAVTGTADSFDPNANNQVTSMVLQLDGKIVAGGQFTNIGGASRSRIGRLDGTTGVADSWDPSANSTVTSIALQADGKIVVGGFFQSGFGTPTIGGQTRNRVARLDPVTGSADSFNPNANSFVRVVKVQADGKVLVGGDFSGASSIAGVTRNRIARLDPVTGTADTFDPNASSAAVLAISLQSDGKLLIGGTFTALSPNGGATVARNQIARLENDGRADRTVNDLNLTAEFNPKVNAIAVQPDGKILIGGYFNSVLGVTQNNIARLHTDGSVDLLFNPDPNLNVQSIAVQPDGKILVGGDFTIIGGQPRNRIARLDGSTGAVDSFNSSSSTNGSVYSIVVQADGKILIGGGFTSVGGATRSRIARLDPITGLADGWNPSANGIVFAIALPADGKILAGGSFSSIGGQPRIGIARLDPGNGSADSWDPNPNGGVVSIAVQSDGKILAGGVFSSIGGQTRNRIARLDAATGSADSFDPNQLRQMSASTDNAIIIP